MLREFRLGEPAVIFDSTLARPTFRTKTAFVRDPAELKLRLTGLTHFVVCIGAENGFARWKTAQRLQQLGLKSLSLLHPRAFVDPTARMGEGSQIMPGAVVHKFTRVGAQALLNTGCVIDHECELGRGVHVMGSAAIAGRVLIGDFATIGTNATVLPNLRVGRGALIGAGAVVTSDVGPLEVVAGVPARLLRKQELQFLGEALDLLGTGTALRPRSRGSRR